MTKSERNSPRPRGPSWQRQGFDYKRIGSPGIQGSVDEAAKVQSRKTVDQSRHESVARGRRQSRDVQGDLSVLFFITVAGLQERISRGSSKSVDNRGSQWEG